MRFLQIVTSAGQSQAPERRELIGRIIRERIAAGTLLATGGLGKRDTAAARVVRKNGEVTVEDPPGGDGWMAAGGYSLLSFATKAEAIVEAKRTLDLMGDGTIELIGVSEMYPPAPSANLPSGVVPYLSLEGASEASTFYQKAFAAKEITRMASEDGKRLMHCHLEINGGALMIADNFPEMGAGPVQRSDSYTMQLVVANGDDWWKRAIDAGCKEKLPFNVAPWGDKYGQLVDPYGVTWAINSPAAK